jgi:hypothetical protein
MKYYTYIVLFLLVVGMGLIFLFPQISINAADQLASEKESINAFLHNENIVVTVTPENQNNGNTMNSTQIWGDYGNGWFLIKDYGSNSDDEQKFTWDLVTLDTSNDSYYWDKDRGLFCYTSDKHGEMDLFKIYVKYKRDFSQNSNKDNTLEFYKTFYLGDSKQDVQLTTNSELEQYAPVSQDFPVIVTQNTMVELYVDAAKAPESYSVKIIGDNYMQNVSTDPDNTIGNKSTFYWIPDKCGTFYIAVYDSDSNLVLKRKVHVNSSNNKYLKFDNLLINTRNSVTYIRLKVAGTRPEGFNEEINTRLKIVVSEPSVWSKTIKNYGDIVAYDENSGFYEINEEGENFKFGSGNYYISASIKTPNSVEPEDSIGRYHSSNRIDVDDFNMIWICESGESNNDGSYSKKGNNPLKFEFVVNKCQDDCEYAFFLSDARGTNRMVKDYSDVKIFEWSPADPGEYKISARIRKKGQNSNLPNSYEKEVYTEIRIAHPDNPIAIEKVKINDNEWEFDNGEGKLVKSVDSIKAHSLKAIEIIADCRGNVEKSSLMYKVSAVRNGYYYVGGPYTVSNNIPFYFRNPGEYRLIVMVKDSLSGSWEDKCVILINVVDEEGNNEGNNEV